MIESSDFLDIEFESPHATNLHHSCEQMPERFHVSRIAFARVAARWQAEQRELAVGPCDFSQNTLELTGFYCVTTVCLQGQLPAVTTGSMKDKKLPPLSIRFEPDVKAILDRLAKEQDRSIAWLVNSALRAHFTREKLLASRTPKAGGSAG